MKRTAYVVLFASIFAVAVGTLGLGTNTTGLMVAASPQSQVEGVNILGHVEYKLLDENGDIKAYMQNDNIVVEQGKDCASQYIFANGGAQVGSCVATNTLGKAFTHIGIGNGTTGTTLSANNQTLADASDDSEAHCSRSALNDGRPAGGEMARRNVTASFDVSGTNTIVTLDTSSSPFTFNAGNATSVKDSGIFNGPYVGGTQVDGQCPFDAQQDAGSSGDWNMFSRQLLNTDQGITVGSGDSLSVKWTITVG